MLGRSRVGNDLWPIFQLLVSNKDQTNPCAAFCPGQSGPQGAFLVYPRRTLQSRKNSTKWSIRKLGAVTLQRASYRCPSSTSCRWKHLPQRVVGKTSWDITCKSIKSLALRSLNTPSGSTALFLSPAEVGGQACWYRLPFSDSDHHICSTLTRLLCCQGVFASMSKWPCQLLNVGCPSLKMSINKSPGHLLHPTPFSRYVTIDFPFHSLHFFPFPIPLPTSSFLLFFFLISGFHFLYVCFVRILISRYYFYNQRKSQTS